MRWIGDTENTQATDSGVNFDQVVANALTEDGVLPASAIRFAIDQVRLESDNYTSNVFMTDDNLDGYKYVDGAEFQEGPGLQSPEGDYYAQYASVENSAHELSAWWARRVSQDGFDLGTLTSISAYAGALKQFGWYQSSQLAYAARMTAVDGLVSLQSMGINTQGQSLTTISLVGIAAIALGVYFIMEK